jgi:hypothetical protein
LIDRGETPGQFDARPGLDAGDEMREHLIEDVNLFAGQLRGGDEEEVGNPPQRLDAFLT